MNRYVLYRLGFLRRIEIFQVKREQKVFFVQRSPSGVLSHKQICHLQQWFCYKIQNLLFPKQKKHIQGHHVLNKITHPVAVSCCSGNLCANINGQSQQQDTAEINPETTLIPLTQEEINIALVCVKVDKNQ